MCFGIVPKVFFLSNLLLHKSEYLLIFADIPQISNNSKVMESKRYKTIPFSLGFSFQAFNDEPSTLVRREKNSVSTEIR